LIFFVLLFVCQISVDMPWRDPLLHLQTSISFQAHNSNLFLIPTATPTKFLNIFLENRISYVMGI